MDGGGAARATGFDAMQRQAHQTDLVGEQSAQAELKREVVALVGDDQGIEVLGPDIGVFEGARHDAPGPVAWGRAIDIAAESLDSATEDQNVARHRCRQLTAPSCARARPGPTPYG